MTQTSGGIRIEPAAHISHEAIGDSLDWFAKTVHAQTRRQDRHHRTVDPDRAGHRHRRYAALWLADLAFKIDFRFWIVALKLMSTRQLLIFLIYLVPFTAFLVIALHVLHRNFSTTGAGRGALYLTNILALTLGFIALLGLQYGTLWLTGMLFNPLPDPSFVPLLAITAIIATFTWRRTGSSLPGALICGIFVTWYVAAATAPQAAF